MSKLKIAQLGHVAEGGPWRKKSSAPFAPHKHSELKKNSRPCMMFTLTRRILSILESPSSTDAVSLASFIIYAAYGLAFSFGATLILRGEANVDVVVNVFLAILIGSFSLELLAPELQAISNARGAAAQLFDTIDRVPPIDSASPNGLHPDPASIKGHISFEDVRFNYPSRPDIPILKGVHLDFPAGKTAALVGASGSGKSTVVALVDRFYDPLSGSIQLDGIEIRDLNVKWLRSQIGLVSQEPTLFATTIRGNVEHGLIGTGMENLPDEERMAKVKEACIKANADGFITALPEGYNTMVGERGFLLSGGQKQRIAIARAIASDPKVLLLDEATSALDTQSEGVVQNALDKASKGRTTVTIAHPLSTIKDAAMIYVMEDGLVLEQGTHNDLLKNAEGPYARLVQAQKLKEMEQRDAEVADTSGTNTPIPGVGSSADPSDLNAILREKQREKMAKEKADREIEEAAFAEKPLGRTETSKSLASEILKQKKSQQGDADEKGY